MIYLDPPFNSQATYNVLFQSPAEDAASAQAEAFRDMWTWTDEAEWSYAEAMKLGGGLARIVDALHGALGNSDLMAYLVMMAVRLDALETKLKQSGSLFLHCDPTASHYLKVLLDGIFGPGAFRSEVIWKRTSAHSSARRFGPVHDVILFYTRSNDYTWNKVFQEYDPSYIENFYTHSDDDGRRWRRSDLTGAGIRRGATGKPWRNIDITSKGRHWAYPPEKLEELEESGRIHWLRKRAGCQC